MKRYCLALDLKDDPSLIAEYESHHAEVWPEVRDSFRRAGIENVELYIRVTGFLCYSILMKLFLLKEKTKSMMKIL